MNTLSDDYIYRFASVGRLYGQSGLVRISRSHVVVVGLGGVGSWTAEALVRSGVGQITLIDYDDVCLSNTSRQIQAMTGAVGQMKVQVLAERFLNIHPQIVVNVVMEKFDSSTASRLLQGEIDFVVDATDGFHEKCLLMSMCKEYGLPMVTVGGSGGRRDPTAVRIADLAKTHGDRLLQKTRKELRFKYAMGMKGKPFGIPCVYSSELPYYPAEDGCVTQDPSFRPRQRLDCSSGMGTVVTVTATFGFFAASVALSGIAEKV